MKPAALFYDIDGTLYSEIDNVVPESAFEALKKGERKRTLSVYQYRADLLQYAFSNQTLSV